MTRRKSVCLKWTLVLLVVVVCPSVYTRPQEALATTTSSGQNEQSTKTPIRYRYRHNNISLNSFKLAPIVISSVNNTNHNDTAIIVNENSQVPLINTSTKDSGPFYRDTSYNRTARLIQSNSRESKKKYKPKPVKIKHHEAISTHDRKKPAIRKVITKWRDKTKYDDLNFSVESTTMAEQTKDINKITSSHSNDVTSTESSEEANSKRYTRPPNNMYYNGQPNDMHYNMYNKPRPQYSEETHVYSTNIQVMEPNPHHHIQVMDHPYPYPTRPSYMQTYVPTPTPVITNVGYPQPWTQTVRKTTTPRPRPTKYEYQNNVNNYGGNYEVTTGQPTNSYTDRIVIRPQEYSPSAEDCPTIYLTLNNTFQGQGKEACPDLNIAVNTNVINKNVVVESEEDGDSLFPGFGLGLGDSGLNIGDDSGTDSSKDEDYFESEENADQADSASVEGTELVNYHSVNSPIQSESSEAAGGYGSATSQTAAITKPGRPGSGDDDIFSFSSLVDFFRPALNAFGWLTTISPLSIGLFPLLLAPLGLLFAGSGFAALFAPWFFPIGREAPKVIHVYKPELRWDNHLKTWQLHSFPNNRKVVPELGRLSTEVKEEGKAMPTLFSNLKNWMIDVTNRLKKRTNNNTVLRRRKSKRRKREIWAQRVK